MRVRPLQCRSLQRDDGIPLRERSAKVVEFPDGACRPILRDLSAGWTGLSGFQAYVSIRRSIRRSRP